MCDREIIWIGLSLIITGGFTSGFRGQKGDVREIRSTRGILRSSASLEDCGAQPHVKECRQPLGAEPTASMEMGTHSHNVKEPNLPHRVHSEEEPSGTPECRADDVLISA